MKKKIESLIKKYNRQAERAEDREKELKEREDILSVHGFWDLGYFSCKATLYRDIVDDLCEILDSVPENILTDGMDPQKTEGNE